MSLAPYKVVIAGGGVAGLEAALALRELAGDRVKTTILAAEPHFWYRPMSVLEPFARVPARRHSVARMAADAGGELCRDSLCRVDSDRRIAHTRGGRSVDYDALVLAYGTRTLSCFRNARTIDDRHLDERVYGVVQDVKDGYAQRLAFVAPAQMAWPLPLYELALMTARAAYVEVSITIATPEPAPLSVFGEAASRKVEELLQRNNVLMVTAAGCGVPEPGRVSLGPGQRELHVDSVIALPQLVALRMPGVPSGSLGFIPTDGGYRVDGLQNVYAAGDATDFPIKHGGIAAQQADAAAGEIAALAGATVEPQEFEPVLRGMLLGGDRPLFMSARLVDGRPLASEVAEKPLWTPATKIAARYLGPYLDRAEAATDATTPAWR